MKATRPAAVAGAFYPASAEELRQMVDGYLAAGTQKCACDALSAGKRAPKAIVAPHAGYVYSGAVAGMAYALFAPMASCIERVVVLGPAHRVWVRGLALPDVSRFETPLGLVSIDTEALTAIAQLRQVSTSGAVHAREHSIEVHLPFLQRLLGNPRIVPLAVGDATAEEVAEVLAALWGGEETRIVVSSDLSHYLPYAAAKRTDEGTAKRLVDARPLEREQACGATAVNGLLLESKRRGLEARVVELCNSGDTAGPRNEVVGYGAFAFYEQRDVH